MITATAEPSGTRTVDSSSQTCADLGTDTPTDTPTGAGTAPPPSGDVLDGNFTQQRTFAAGIEQITLEAEFSATVSGFGSETRFEVVGADGSSQVLFTLAGVDGQTDTASKSITADLSAYAGQTVTFRYVVVNDSDSTAEMEIRSFKIKKDTDGDGLSDSVENSSCLLTGTMHCVQTDADSVDTDGDGLEDGYELGEQLTFGFQTYYNASSYPDDPNSDEDAFDDDTEVQLLSDALDADTDNDGTIDSKDVDIFNAPPEPPSAYERASEALLEGAALGEAGMPGRVAESQYANSPWYLVGWLSLAVLPVVDGPADLRDAAVNLANGNLGAALLDLLGLIPAVISDLPKTFEVIKIWIANYPGKTGDALRLVSSSFLGGIPENRVDDYYKAFSEWGEVKRLKGQVDEHPKFENTKKFGKQLNKNLKEINKGPVNGKTTKRLELTDIDRVVYDKDGKLVILINTNKWKSSEFADVLIDGPGYKHTIARHGHPDAVNPDSYPVTPGMYAPQKDPTHLYPKTYDNNDVKDLIMRAVDGSDSSITRKSKDQAEYVYDVGEDGIDELVIIRNDQYGLIIGAWPEGKHVDEYGDITK